MTSSTTPTAEATSAASSAVPKLDTWIAAESMPEINFRIAASASRISTKPSSAMNGRRSAAISGGTIAFRIAIARLTPIAPTKPLTETPGTISAARKSEAAERSQPIRRRGARKRGRPGCQTTSSPYTASSAIFARQANSHPAGLGGAR